MDATPISTETPSPERGSLTRSGCVQFGQGSASAFSMKWSALHEAAHAVAAIAGAPGAPISSHVRHFPAAMRDAEGWRRTLIEQGVEDLSALMEPGLSALLSAMARGGYPRIAAQALWIEFTTARDSVLGLLPYHPNGPRRLA